MLIVAGIVLMLAPVAFAGETYKYAKDLFTNVGYSGNDGNRSWTADWKEEGESNGPSQGLVRSVNDPGNCPEGSNCLLIKGGGLLSSVAAKRFVNTSDLVDTELCYKIRRYDNSLLSLDPPRLIVEVTDDGQSWEEVASYNLNTDDETYVYQSHGVEDFASATFGVRFRVTDILPATEDVGVFIDFVEVKGTIPASTTTSSTSSTTTSLPITTTSLPITTTLPTLPTTTLPGLPTTSTSSTTTTTTKGTTTTTEGGAATTSTTPGSSNGQSGGSSSDGSTSSTTGSTESTLPSQPGENEVTETSTAPGLREASIGIQAAFDGGRFGSLEGADFEVMGIDIAPNYTMAVEVIESSWVYLLVLIMLIAAAIVSGLDRRRLKRAKHTDV